MRYVYLALNWIFGLLFLLTGLVSVFSSPLAGIAMLAIAMLLLPPVRNFAYLKTGKALPIKARAAVIFVLFIAFGIFVGQDESRKAQEVAAKEAQAQAEKAAAMRQQNIDYFNQNSVQILGEVKEAIAKGDYTKATALSSKYLASQNSELLDLSAQAKAAQSAAERKEKTQTILSQLKDVPASALQKNRDLYQQLVSLNPDVPAYAEKLKFFSDKVKQQEEKERLAQEKIQKENEARLAKFGKPPVASGWDGSYLAVNRYLERVANDPDSIKMDGCTKVYTTDKGWLVGCDYRGRNAFGGMIRQSNWFTIAHDTVIQMHDASAFKP
ncbi:TPA: hypothetical protein ACXI9S_003594 [Pseudomonas aeruginosa]|nr:hypothetical protein [Pseudomonas aeruginosa]